MQDREVKKMNIAQAAKQFGLTAATLRYYERVGLIPPRNVKKAAFAIMMKRISNGLNSLNACEVRDSRLKR